MSMNVSEFSSVRTKFRYILFDAILTEFIIDERKVKKKEFASN